jgi:hypothetical protein
VRPGTGLLNKPIPWPSGPLATHLRDARGQPPIFTGFSAGHQIGLVAHDAYEWLDRLVDVAITSMAELLTAR